MSVKNSSSGGRVLAVLESVARHQPVGVSELARRLESDKTAVQRALATLAAQGWIRPEPGRKQVKWELTAHLHAVARLGHENSSVAKRIRPVLQRLRDEFDETMLLTVPSAGELVLVDVVESHQMLKYVPPAGLIVPLESAAGHAILARMDGKALQGMLGRTPPPEFLRRLETVRQDGYAVHRFHDHASVAAAMLEADGNPGAAIVLSGPLQRVGPERYARIGARLAQAAAALSAAPEAAGAARNAADGGRRNAPTLPAAAGPGAG